MKKDLKKPSFRINKVEALAQQIIGVSIRPFLENLPGFTTVSKVQVSKDMKWAKVYISIVGGDDKKIFDALNRNIYDIQGELNNQLAVKIVPRISFHLDESPRYAQHIEEIIKEIHKD